MAKPGRSCPRHYRYSPAVFARAADIKAQSLYVVGGLYGNPFALETVLDLARREGAMLVFNGDFNWFAADPAGGLPDLRGRLGSLPTHLVAEVGGLRVGIAHGDAESLAGWQFSQEALRERPERAQALLAGAAVDVFACTHTCLPVMQDFATPRGMALIVNNGAAGMPNFRDTRFGLATRIANVPSMEALYGARLGAIVVEAVPVRYDHEAWLARFDRVWPAGSPASLSYRKRIASGPGYEVEQALRTNSNGALSRAA